MSVGASRQYLGRLGKVDNERVLTTSSRKPPLRRAGDSGGAIVREGTLGSESNANDQ
jgi:hypothetical protein